MNKVLQHSKLFLKRNSSTILTCIGAAGVVVTAVTAVKATPKAMILLEKAKEEKGDVLTNFEKVKVAAPVYIPAMVIGASTIACIFGANALNKRTQAGLMSAYALLDNTYKEYKDKVKDIYGEEADDRVREKIAEDKYDGDYEIEDGKTLFYDEFSGRYFESTTEEVLRAQYELNRIVSSYGGAFLNEYYELLGLIPTDYGNHLGWSAVELSEMYWESWVVFHHHKVILDDGLECMIISMRTEPMPDFENY